MADFVPTGVSGLDELLDGKGFRRGHIVLVLGVPGSGKTTIGVQFLLKGAQAGETGVYVSLDESPSILKENAKAVGLDCEKYEEKGLVSFIDASPIRHIPGDVRLAGVQVGKRDFALSGFIAALREKVAELKASRLVIDPLSTLMIQYPSLADRRTAFLDLMQAATETRCTCLLVSELSQPSLKRQHTFEEYLTHGVIVMTRILVSGGIIRVFSVEKMRGMAHDDQPHPYKIGPGGVEVYHLEAAF